MRGRRSKKIHGRPLSALPPRCTVQYGKSQNSSIRGQAESDAIPFDFISLVDAVRLDRQ